MKKLMLLLMIVVTIITTSCSEQEIQRTDDTLSPKDQERPRWSAVGCSILDEYGNIIAAGVRCRWQNGGGCKKSSPCTSVSKSISDMIINLAGGTTQDRIEAVQIYQDYDTQLELYKYDPDLYKHPDSIN